MKTIKQVIAEYIARERADIAEHDAIRNILAPLVGKPIDGRTFNKRRLPDGYKFYAKHSWFVIAAPSGREHQIGYNSDPYVSLENYEKHDACNGSAALARITKCESLNIEALEKIHSDIVKGLELIFNALNSKECDSYTNPVYYDMLSNIWNEEKTQYNKFSLSDLHYPAKDYHKNGNKLINN